MKIGRSIAILLILFCLQASAQFSNEVFHDGFLVTTKGDTIRGKIKYDLETNIVQLVRNNVVKTFSSQQVFYVEIFDKITENYRQFYSISYAVNYGYEVPILFEVLYEGPISLLAREEVVQEAVNNNSAYWGGSFMQDRLAYSFYFLDKKGKIDYYSGKRNELFAAFPRHSNKVKTFVKENKLKTDEVRDLIRIVAFVNSL